MEKINTDKILMRKSPTWRPKKPIMTIRNFVF